MTAPRLSQDELWAGICNLEGQRIESLTGKSSHRVGSVDKVQKRYEVKYKSGSVAVVSSDELYALYRELYARGSLTNSYMTENARKVLGWESWNRPGSVMFAILPLIDNSIQVDGGSLRVLVRDVMPSAGWLAEKSRRGPRQWRSVISPSGFTRLSASKCRPKIPAYRTAGSFIYSAHCRPQMTI
jgi:hypothetical protein